MGIKIKNCIILLIICLSMSCENKEGGLYLYEADISKSYKGQVIDKISTKPNMKRTHLRIRTNDKNLVTINVYQSTLDEIEIGDSVVKLKNENFIYLPNKNKKLRYRKLTKQVEEKLKLKFPYLILDQ